MFMNIPNILYKVRFTQSNLLKPVKSRLFASLLAKYLDIFCDTDLPWEFPLLSFLWGLGCWVQNNWTTVTVVLETIQTCHPKQKTDKCLWGQRNARRPGAFEWVSVVWQGSWDGGGVGKLVQRCWEIGPCTRVQLVEDPMASWGTTARIWGWPVGPGEW